MEPTNTEETPNLQNTSDEELSDDTQTIVVKKHPLNQSYTFWYMNRQDIPRTRDATVYIQHLKQIGSFRSVEDFWGCYNHIKRTDQLPHDYDFHVFRTGVSPTWEHDENKLGGKFIIRVQKHNRYKTARLWEDLILAFVGNQLGVPNEEVCGIVLSPRFHQDIISVWNKHAEATDFKETIKKNIKRVLNLPPRPDLEYKHHDQSIKDNSSFRNTESPRQWK
eukprot:TRINITY_DN221_c0_g2_i1.p1 TRINITY_DN221_c0_g2~~TRINITY_DN221_c0_g2_i1.p1  ORF type:complete len:234 (-),score=34.38 TRINITY_DN221_c0_g2_i1:62-724(-)